MEYLFLILFILIIISCAAALCALVWLIVTYGRRIKSEGWALICVLAVLLFIAIDWGIDRTQETLHCAAARSENRTS